MTPPRHASVPKASARPRISYSVLPLCPTRRLSAAFDASPLSEMVVPHMVGGMKIGKWHGALAHGHEIFVAGHSGGGDTSKNERAMAPLKDFYHRSRKSHKHQDADLLRIQDRKASERLSHSTCVVKAVLLLEPAPNRHPAFENRPCGKHPARCITLARCTRPPARSTRPAPCQPFDLGSAPVWDDSLLACGPLTPQRRCDIVLQALIADLCLPQDVLHGVKAYLHGGLRLVHSDGQELGIVRATTRFNGDPRYNDVRFLLQSGVDGVPPTLVFARLALVLTLTPNRDPRVQRTVAVLRMFREVPASAEDVDTFGQNLEFVPMRERGSFFAADAAVVEDTWSLEPDVCVKGRFHPNQHFRSTTVEALERSDAAGPRVTA